MTQHNKVPDQLLEELSAGDLSGERQRKVLEQLQAEPGGMARLEALKASNETILARYQPPIVAAEIRRRFARDLESRPGLFRLRPFNFKIVAPVMAAAACALFAVLVFMQDPNGYVAPGFASLDTEEVVRIKGDPQLMIHGKQGNDTIRLYPDASAEEGDVLQLTYSSKGAAHGVIFSIDGRGFVTLHFPADEMTSTRLEQKGIHPLGFSYELDDAPGFERFFFVWSKEDIDVRRVLEAAENWNLNTDNKLDLDENQYYRDYILHKRTEE